MRSLGMLGTRIETEALLDLIGRLEGEWLFEFHRAATGSWKLRLMVAIVPSGPVRSGLA